MTDINKLKLDLIKMIIETDDPALLKEVLSFLQQFDTQTVQEPVAIYSSTGTEVDESKVEQDVKEARIQYANGETISLEELKKEAKSW